MNAIAAEINAVCEKIKEGNLNYLMDFFRLKPELLNERVNGETFLHISAAYNQKEIIDFFILWGIGVNEKNDRGEAPIHKAVSKEVLELLLARGADINARDSKGRTFVYNGALRDSCSLVDYMALKGADLNAKTIDGVTPVMQAVAGGHVKMVELLIAMGANVNLQDDSGDTALHSSVLYENPEMLKTLALHGADVNIKNNDGVTPFGEARSKNLLRLMQLLLQFGAKE